MPVSIFVSIQINDAFVQASLWLLFGKLISTSKPLIDPLQRKIGQKKIGPLTHPKGYASRPVSILVSFQINDVSVQPSRWLPFGKLISSSKPQIDLANKYWTKKLLDQSLTP